MREVKRVCVISAARNEAKTIREFIKSVLRQKGINLKLVVVDDGSTDGTGDIVRDYAFRYPNITYLRVDSTPKGWTPKVYAQWVGFREGCRGWGDYLVFLDADVSLEDPQVIRHLVGLVNEKTIASTHPTFKCGTWLCNSVIVALITFTHAFIGFHKVLNPEDPLKWFYGCCWCVRREDYLALGGHEAVKNELVEDKAFSDIAKGRGFKFTVIHPEGKVVTPWYPTLRENLKALVRVLSRHTKGLPKLKVLAEAVAITLVYSLPYLTLLTGSLTLNYLTLLASTTAIFLQLAAHLITALKMGVPPTHALIAPAFSSLIPVALITSKRGREVEWKGRKIIAGS